ncbi:hypothetical protein DPMN_097423 [Dreissena polymorpha]|uniref:Cytochrome P450 n=1 Tax=Dreissena polymorpha TaxID=45954 RepID=A0A9D4R6C9_DREPO|nr:hypothetical protein DPMN_097423 [Dreissena polymorpha]
MYWSTRRHPGITPGPGRWPIIGNLGSLAGPDKLKVFRDLRFIYGDVFALYFGSELSVGFASVMFNILHGKRPERDDKRFHWYIDEIELGFQDFLRNQLRHYCFPWFDKLPGDLLRLKYNREKSVLTSEYFDEVVRQKEAVALHGSRDCLLDFFLSKDSPLARDEIWKCHHDLMAAGSETSAATTMHWMILLLALYPEVQAKLHAEITRKIGKELPAISGPFRNSIRGSSDTGNFADWKQRAFGLIL